MIEAIEKSAWMDVLGNPVDDKGYGALGNVFMPMQANWNAGECAFPLDQAVDWTTRVLKAGGTLTWVAPRDGSQMQADQFALLLKINAAVEN